MPNIISVLTNEAMPGLAKKGFLESPVSADREASY